LEGEFTHYIMHGSSSHRKRMENNLQKHDVDTFI
jgi:hypothetical protein